MPHLDPSDQPPTHRRRLLLDDGAELAPVDVDSRAGIHDLAPFWTRATWSNQLYKEVRWLGLPMLQLPEDVLMLQEVFWDVRPDVVVETGVARGGSTILWASLLAMGGGREVVGVDIHIPSDVREAVETHPLGGFAHLVEGNSVAEDVVARVRERIRDDDRVLVVLDSDHSRAHVRAELESYAPVVTPGSYLVATDGVMQSLADAPRGRAEWAHDNPLAAVNEWLEERDDYERDESRERLLATYFPSAWLRRRGQLPPRTSGTSWGEPISDVHEQRTVLMARSDELERELQAAIAAREAAESQVRELLETRTWRAGRAIVRPVGILGRRLRGQPAPTGPELRVGKGQPADQRRASLSPGSLRYLDLLKRSLTGSIHGDPYRPYGPDRGTDAYRTWQQLRDQVPHDDVELVRRIGFDAERREVGRDWPSQAETMVGQARLDNVQMCITSVHDDGVPGDLVETGVWRGGAAILMRAVLRELGDTGRVVWACDSFEGLPPPDPERWPKEKGDRHHLRPELAVSLDDVRANFARYGLLDAQVRFAKGWFEDTLAVLPSEQIAVLRLDGDMYGSTMVALEALEPRVPSGGYVIVDDYGAIEQCRQAVQDYREARRITAEIHRVDWTGAWWRKP